MSIVSFLFSIIIPVIVGLLLWGIKKSIEYFLLKYIKSILIKYSVYFDAKYQVYKLEIKLLNKGKENININSVKLEGKNYSEDIHFHEYETPILPNTSKIDQYGLSSESINKTDKIVVYYNADKKVKIKLNLKKEIKNVEK